MTSEEWFRQQVAAMVDTVMGRRGFTVPFYAVAVGANGGLLHMPLTRTRKV